MRKPNLSLLNQQMTVHHLYTFILLSLFMVSTSLAFSNSKPFSSPKFSDHFNCDNVTDGGTIIGNQTGCNDPLFDPSIILNDTLASGGTGTMEYLWMYTTNDLDDSFINWNIIPNSNSPNYDPTPIAQTTHYVRCARRAGCTEYIKESNAVTITVDCTPPCDLAVYFTTTQDGCSNINTGAAMANPSNGTAPYMYTWSNGANTPTINNLASGTYTLTLTDANNCELIESVYISGISNTIDIQTSVTNASCGSASNGAIDISVSGGTNPYIYNWSNTAQSEDLSDIPAGVYTLTVTDSQGCTATTSQSVNEGLGFEIVSNTISANCGESNGSITITTIGGTAPFQYNWNTNQTTNTINNIGAGTYAVTVTDAASCSATSIITLSTTDGLASSSSHTNTECGENNGTATVSAIGGTAPYTYVWNDPNNQTTATATNLSAGTYTAIITDANACTSSEVVTVYSTAETQLELTATNVSCAGGNDGTITVQILTGLAPFTYEWNNGVDNVQNPTGLSAGLYCVMVKDANECIVTKCIQVEDGISFDIDLSASATTCGNDNGSIQTTINGGNSPYQFNWNNAENVQNPSGLSAGVYCVTATDANGCEAIECINIENSESPVIQLFGTEPSCGASNGSITATVSGGSGAYTYVWDNAPNVQNPTNLAAGTYCLTVTDEKNCSATACIDLNSSVALHLDITTVQPTCMQATGSISIVAMMGAAPYSYQWNNSLPMAANQENLIAGNYCVTVTDNLGCVASQCVDLVDEDLFTIDLTAMATTCGEDNGSVQTTISGQTGALQFKWNNNADTQNLTNVEAGIYCVTVTDDNNCEVIDCVNVANSSAPNITLTAVHPTCNEANGSITTVVSGTSGIVTFDWDNAENIQNPTGLAAGMYCVTITDTKNCTTEKCITLDDSDALDVDLFTVNATCREANGELLVSIKTGEAPFTYEWDNGLPAIADPTGLLPNTYCVTVTDNDGCTASECTEIIDLQPFEIDLDATNTRCGLDNGTIDINIIAGSGAYEFIWNNGMDIQNLENLSAGTYCVTVNDNRGCSDNACVTIDDSEAIVVSLEGMPPNCGVSDGRITTMVSNGYGDYTFDWDNATDMQNPSNLEAGTYCVTVTDEKNCTATACINLDNVSTINIDLQGTNASCGDNSGSIQTMITGTNVDYDIDWDNAPDVLNPTGLTNGIYCITVTDDNDCAVSECITLDGTEAIDIEFETIDPTCGLANGSIETTITGGTGMYDIDWDFTLDVQNPRFLFGGTYCLTVNDDSGCSASKCVTLEQGLAIELELIASDVICHGMDNGSIQLTVTEGTAPYTFEWDNGATNQNLSDLSAGNYCVTVTDAIDCVTTACIEVGSPDLLSINPTINEPSCGENNGSIMTIITGGVGDYTYEWNTTAATSSIDELDIGEYCVTVTDENNCTISDCYTLTRGDELFAATNVNQPFCPDDLGAIAVGVSGGSAPYTYEWSNMSNFPVQTNLGTGTYCVTITDATDCSLVLCEDILVPDAITIVESPSSPNCFGMSDGAIDIGVSGGTGAYEFNWDNGATTEDIDNLESGTYCVTVTDDNNCTASTCIEVETMALLEVEAAITNVTCALFADGKIELSVTGGTGSYTYDWNNGGSNASMSNLTGGTYCVTINDMNACELIECFDVIEPDNLIGNFIVTNPTCNADVNGIIELDIQGGTAPYTVEWDNEESSLTRNNLAAGEYCVTITDANGCDFDGCTTIVAPDQIVIIGIGEAPTCAGGDDANIELMVSGGQAPYTYNWETGAATANISNLTSGTYCVTVTDANNCIQEACTTILDDSAIELEITVTDATCEGDVGAVLVNVLLGSGTYTYAWDTPNMDTTEGVSDLAGGTYTVTVTDDDGCSATMSADVDEPDFLDCFDLVNIGDFVWLDENQDGLQDPNESGVPNVQVNLIDPGPDGIFNSSDDIIYDTQYTDADGMYLFEDIPPGTYIIEFVPATIPTGSTFTGSNEGTDDGLDSDANFFSGQTQPFDIVNGQPDDLSFDAGVLVACDNIQHGGEICCDQIVCGAGANPDPILSITPASGGTGDIEYLWMMNTTGSSFSFNNPDWIPIINSDNESYDPNAVFQTTFYIRCARRSGCNTFTGETDIIKIEVHPGVVAEPVDPITEVCENKPAMFTAADGGGGAIYEWDFGTSATPQTATTKTVDVVTWSTIGSKTVTLTVSVNGCVESTTFNVDVLNCIEDGLGDDSDDRFLAFNAFTDDQKTVQLIWKTNPNLVDQVFVIEHSKDGDDYNHVDVLEGGNLAQANEYIFEHHAPKSGQNFYRIKHLNHNGLVDLTDSKKLVLTNNKTRFSVFPNPVLHQLNVELLEEETQNVSIQLINAMGQIVKNEALQNGETYIQLDVKDCPSGAYYLIVEEAGKERVVQKVFKTRD